MGPGHSGALFNYTIMNLIIDGNAAINIVSRIVINKLNEVPGPTFYDIDEYNRVLTEQSKDYFDEFISKYLLNIIGLFKRDLTNVHIVFDRPNWRKKYVDWYYKQPSNSGKDKFIYKEKRDTDKDREHRKNLSAFFNFINEEYIDKLRSVSGLNVTYVNGAEGDDIIYYLCNTIEDDIIIWSVDTDLIQLVKRDDKSIFLVTPKQGKSKKKIFITEDFKNPKSEKDVDFLDLLDVQLDGYDPMEVITYLKEYKEHEIHEIDPIVDIFAKVLAGDKKSDNIPSVHTWESSGRTMTLTDKKAREIISNILKTYSKDKLFDYLDIKDEGFINNIINLIITKYDLDPKDEDKKKLLKDNILLNYKLIKLKKGCIPDIIYNKINEEHTKNETKDVFNITDFEKRMLNSLKI